MSQKRLSEWLNNLGYLPPILRDFHDQKDIFKELHHAIRESPFAQQVPTWVNGQIYVIDWFLYFMARRGYTLQKSRSKLPFVGFDGPPKAPLFPFQKAQE